MKSVYITYSGKNCEAVLQIMETLVRNGYALMCECMLPFGADPEEQARRYISQADGVVAIITEDAEGCPYMGRDLAWAMEAETKLLLVAVGNGTVPVGMPHACTISEFPTIDEMNTFAKRLHGMIEGEDT